MIKQTYSPLAEIGGRIWAFWGMLFFIVTITICFFLFYWPCYLMKEPRATRWHHKVSRAWMVIYLNGVGCPLRVSNKQYFVKGENHVVVCNHNSFMDVFSASPFVPNASRTIAKKEFAWIPVVGWVYSLGSVLVDRKSIESRKRSYSRMKAVLRLGLDMIIYPEGTRNKTDKAIGTFQDGAFRLAKDTGKPIIPAVIFNSRKILPPEKTFFMMPHRLYMHFLPPVLPDHPTAGELKETVFQMMLQYYEENEGKM